MDKLINKKIENYTILSLLGKGGMGVVYKAHDSKLNRYVAIKVLNAPEVKNSKRMIERFKIEAQNHAQLIHQNIVTVYGFVEFDNVLGIVMEYVDGESLEKVIFKNRRLHVFDVVYIVTQLLDGIGYAHSKGYIHRDIKPSNIIVNSEGVVKIMDFGISKSIEGENSGTQTSARIGTIYYMSPEQIKGRNVNKTSDIYSIGCTIYDMLTGKPPFDSKNDFEVMEGHLKENPISLSNYYPSIPVALDNIVSKLLKKNQSERYQTCAEVKQDIDQLNILLKTSEANYFNEKKVRRKLSKKKSIFAFSLFVLAFLALVVFVFFQVRDFMNFKGYEVFKKNSISTLFETSEKIELSNIASITLPTKNSLNSIYSDGSEFIIVGDSGTILNKESISNKWNLTELDDKLNINDLWRFDNGNIIFIGEKSSFVYESNGNLQWYSILKENYLLNDILFVDDEDGFVVGSNGLIISTFDGGTKWNKIPSNVKSNLFEINMDNTPIGYIVGMNGTLLKTIDSGLSWKLQEPFTSKYLRSIDFFSDEIGICVGGNGVIFRTTDNGKSWENLEGVTKRPLNKIKFIDKNNVIIVGNRGTVLLSSNSGESWKSVKSKYYENWRDIFINSEREIYLIGSNGKMIKLENGEK